ncbi:CrcB family protein [uncultured Microbacterium sp.]|uniref:fluoride efflux transporter FluC n=1 Tax=uncultured Microbacterium sp. TaxID=191216 RepID=UPI0025E79D42|nr:CrcB family protein [uncultured Microbacterium sp.]
MTPLLFVAVAASGGLGAAFRLFLDGVIRSRSRGPVPWGTITINLTGSLALGLITGLTASQAIPAPLHAVVGAGFLGGYTTFSTASFETIRLLQERKRVTTALVSFGTLLGAAALAGLGLWIGGLW